MIFMASPYTHSSPDVRAERVAAACRASAMILTAGLAVFSPIAYSASILTRVPLPTNWEFWAPMNRAMIQRCEAIWFLMLDGWKDSNGMAAEFSLAQKLQKSILFVAEPDIPEVLARITRP